MNWDMTDLHTHILPAFDDGAQDLDTALNMLRKAKEYGVERLVLTPHFYPMQEDLTLFIQRRQKAFKDLLSHWNADTMPQLKLGAEVHYTAELAQMDLRQLTFADCDYMLLELPGEFMPAHIRQVVQNIVDRGITPILAHVERCAYFRKNPDSLLQLIHLGALAQVTLQSLDSREDKGFSVACLKKGLAHIVASDAHDLCERGAYSNDRVLDQWGETAIRAEEFARSIWSNECPPAFSIAPVKKGIFQYS